ncbi:MAG: DUF2029 domain-containing protein [Lachnospiraceae bacterium]|nr:DUF2029 domain-containing protein [Lachnospiraceae bacterium]
MSLRSWQSKLIFAVLIILAAISVVQGVRNALRFSQDFQWDASRALLIGINPYEQSIADAEEEKAGKSRQLQKEKTISSAVRAKENGGSQKGSEDGEIEDTDPTKSGTEKGQVVNKPGEDLPARGGETEDITFRPLGDQRLDEFYRSFAEIKAPQKMEANQFPSLLMLLFPLALLPWHIAKVIWLLLNLFFTAGIIFLLRKTFFKEIKRELFLAVMLLMVAGTPWRNQIGVGQHTLFSLFFLLLAVFFSEKKGLGAGIAVALSLTLSYFKYTVTAPLALYFIYKRRWKEFAASVLLHIGGTFWAARHLGASFLDMIRQPLQVSSFLTGEGSIDVGVLTGGAAWSPILALVIMGILFFLALRLPKGMDTEYFTLALLFCLIMTYHRSYDFFVLAAAAAGVYGISNSGRYRILSIYTLLLLWIFFGLRLFSENRFSLTIAGIFYYAFLLLYGSELVKRWKQV